MREPQRTTTAPSNTAGAADDLEGHRREGHEAPLRSPPCPSHSPPAVPLHHRRCWRTASMRLLHPLGRLAAGRAGSGFRLHLHRHRAAKPRSQRAAARARIEPKCRRVQACRASVELMISSFLHRLCSQRMCWAFFWSNVHYNYNVQGSLASGGSPAISRRSAPHASKGGAWTPVVMV